MNPLLCSHCGRDLESDDAISIIEGVCCTCRRQAAREHIESGRRAAPRTPPVASTPPARRTPPASVQRPIPRQVDVPWESRTPLIPGPTTPPAPTARQTIPAGPSVPTVSAGASSYGSAPGSLETKAAPADSRRLRRRRRDLFIGVAAGLLVVVGGTAYILTYRTKPVRLALTPEPAAIPIRVTVNPPWAEVKLDDKEIGPLSETGQTTVNLPSTAGDLCWLSAAADGYHSTRRPLSPYSGVGDVMIELVRAPIELAIRSDPPDAQVWIDDQYKGNTPLALTFSPAQKSKLALKREGYRDFTGEIVPPQRGSRLELDCPLERGAIVVSVATEPPGAMVSIDGQVRGVSPVAAELDASSAGKEIEIVAALPGYEPASHRLILPSEAPGEPVSASLALLRPAAELVIETDPPGGEVFVNGRSIGPSPARASFDPTEVGRRITVEGRLDATRAGRATVIVPPAGQPGSVTLELGAIGRRVVFVLASPTGAGTDQALLIDQLVEMIHRLDESQQFSVILCSSDRVQPWPTGDAMATATHDWKIRAYDLIRGVRPSARGDVTEAMRIAAALKPDVLWMVTGGRLRKADLASIAGAQDGPIVNLLQIGSDAVPPWLRQWTYARGGVVRCMEGSTQRLAGRPDADLEAD